MKNLKKVLIIFLTCFICALFFSNAVSAVDNTIINLNNSKGYSNLQEAINDVDTIRGDVLEIQGNYNSVTINKNITLKGVNNVSIKNININRLGSGSVIKGFSNIEYLSLDSVNYCKIFKNTFKEPYNISEIYLFNSHNNLFLKNNMKGINFHIDSSHNNTLKQNHMKLITYGPSFPSFISILNSRNIRLVENNMEYACEFEYVFFIYSDNSTANIRYNRFTGLDNSYISSQNSYINANDNWWGTQTPESYYTYHQGIGKIKLDKWLIVKEKLQNNTLFINLDYNNYYTKTSEKYHVPNNMPVKINNLTLYTKNGQINYTYASNKILNITIDNYSYILNTSIFHSNVVNLNNKIGYNTLQEAINDPLTLNGNVIEIIGNTSGSVLINKNLTIISNNDSWFSQVSITELGRGSRLINFNINQQLTLNNVFDFEIINSTIAYQLMIYDSQNIILENNRISGCLVYISNSADIQIKNNNIYLVRTMPHLPGIIHLVNSDNVNICQNNISLVGMTIQNSQVNINFNNIQRDILLYSNSPVNVNNNWWGIYKITNNNNNIQNDSYLTITEKITNNNTLIIDFTINNQGINTSTQGHIPDGISVQIDNGIYNITLYTVNGQVSCPVTLANLTITIGSYRFKTHVSILNITNYGLRVSRSLESGWYKTPKKLVLTAMDLLNSNSTIYYRINNEEWVSSSETANIFLDEGIHKIQYYAENDGGIGYFYNATYYIDLTAPTVDSDNSGGWINSSSNKTVTLTANDNLDNNPKIYYMVNNDTDFNLANKRITINLTDGMNDIWFLSVDKAGNSGPLYNIKIIYEAYGPDVSINLKAGWYNSTQSVTFSHNSKPNAYLSHKRGNTTISEGYGSITSNLTEGERNLTFSLQESNLTIRYAYIIDLTAPVVINSLNEGVFNSSRTLTLTANDNLDNNPTIYYRVNNGSWMSNSKSINLTLKKGAYKIQYYAKDKAGHTSDIITVNYYIDLIPPTVSFNFTGGSHDQIRTLILTANDNFDTNPTIYYKINNGSWISATKTITITIDLLNDDLYYYAVDSVGNQAKIKSDFSIINNPHYALNVSTNLTEGTYNQDQTVKFTPITNFEGNPEFYYRINKGRWIYSSSPFEVNLTNGEYLIEYLTYNSANNLIKGSFNYYIKDYEEDGWFNYTINIPKYYSVDVINHKNNNYTSFVFPTRYIHIAMNDRVFKFYWHYPKEPPYSGYYDNFEGYSLVNKSSPGGVYFIPENGDPIWLTSISQLNNYNVPGIIINPNNWGIQFDRYLPNDISITYHGYCKDDVNQFSAIFDQHNEYGMSIPEMEGIYLNLNGENKVTIGIYRGLPEYNDVELRRQLTNDIDYTGSFNVQSLSSPYWWNYASFDNNIENILRFSNTNESLFVNENYGSIRAAPSMENITTNFQFNNKDVTKTETITYGRGPYYSPSNGFEIVQSFAIVKTIITDEIMEEWLDKNDSYPIGGMKAAYGTFMLTLTTIWLSDKLAIETAPEYNVTWNRTNFIIVMSGVNYIGCAYIHSLNASMGMNIEGNNETSIIGFRFINSMFLPEIESLAISLSGHQVTSSLENVFLSILSGNFSIIEYDGLGIIMSEGDDNSMLIINMTSGLVNVVRVGDDFVYKGVLSDIADTFWCVHDQISNFITSGIKKTTNYFLGSLDKTKNDILSLIDNIKSNAWNLLMDGGNAVGLRFSFGNFIKVPFTYSSLTLPITLQNFCVNIRDHYIPKDKWQYLSYYTTFNPGPFQSIKTINIPRSDGNYDYIQIPFDGGNSGLLDRNNAIYIDHNTGARTMTPQETYTYISNDYWIPHRNIDDKTNPSKLMRDFLKNNS